MDALDLPAVERFIAGYGVGKLLAELGDHPLAAPIERARAVLDRDPSQLLSQLTGRIDRADRRYAEIMAAVDAAPVEGLRLVSASLEQPGVAPRLGTIAAYRRLVHAVVVLDDGDTCVTASEEGGDLAVMSLATMRVLSRLEGHLGPVNHLVGVPGTDLVVSGGDDWTVRVWDVPAREEVRRLAGHTHFVRQVAVAGGKILSGSQDGTVRVWDLATGECLLVFAGHDADVMAVAVAADGRAAASSSMDNVVLVWDPETGAILRQLYDSGSRLIRFDPLGDTFMTVPSPDADPELHQSCPVWLRFTDDGRELITAENRVIRWDLDTGTKVDRLASSQLQTRAGAVPPDGDGMTLVGLYGVHVWRTAAEPTVLTTASTWSVTYSPDGSTLVTGDDDGGVVVWRGRPGAASIRRPAHLGYVTGTAVAPDGRTGATIDVTGNLQLWDMVAARPATRHSLDVAAHQRPHPSFDADGRLYTSGRDHIAVWDAAAGVELRRLPTPPEFQPFSMAPVPGGLVASAGDIGGVVHWDLATGEYRRLDGPAAYLHSYLMLPGGRLLAYGVHDMRCWDLASGELRWTRTTDTDRPGGPAFLHAMPGAVDTEFICQSPVDRHSLAVYRLADGRSLREIPVRGSVVDSLRLAGALLIAVSDSDNGRAFLHRFTPTAGELIHSVELPTLHTFRFLPGGGYALIRPYRTLDEEVMVVDLSNGSPCARLSTDRTVNQVTLADTGGTALAVDSEATVHILRLSPTFTTR